METTAALDTHRPQTGVPITINNVEGWTCETCRKPADETKSLWYLKVNGRIRVWHPACR